MGIKTPLEDFVKNTLAALPGYWQKLVYFGELRKDTASYDHWGMRRRYGTEASKTAMSAAHTDVFLRILRTPLRTLLADLRSSAAPQNRTQEEYMEKLQEIRDDILPQDEGGGSAQHFDLTVRTLETLIRSAKTEDRPGG
ncbi:MAG TPA: hypothetical protein VMZ25_09205 [Terriglobales bacterium]|nr:hypothetical protein [Terriglobales bacterium]